MAQIVTPNRIKIRSGQGKPSFGEGGLLANELGYDKSNKVLYIGLENGTVAPVATIYKDTNNDGNVTPAT